MKRATTNRAKSDREQYGTLAGWASLVVWIMASSYCLSGCNAGKGERVDTDEYEDADSDGARNGKDLCPDSGDGVVGPDGCGRDDDGDQDGLDTKDDLCPGTETGVEVDHYGCSEDQQQSGVGGPIFGEGDDPAEVAAELLADPPETGTSINGYMAFVINEDSDAPIIFHTFEDNVTETETGFEVEGALLLTTPLGQMPIAEASVVFEHDGDPIYGIETVRGDVSVPFPGEGILKGFEMADLVSASLGLDKGMNLSHLDAPVQPNRSYLFFEFSAGIEVSSGPISFETPINQEVTMVLDPQDPYVYFTGNLLGLDAIGPIEDAAIGVSLRGLIPFAPEVTWGLEDGLADLNGHLYMRAEASVPLVEIPLSISGEMVLDLDPTDEGRTLLEADEFGFAMNVNGELAFDADFLKFFTFKVALANATAGLTLNANEQFAFLSGVAEPDDFLPIDLPIMPSEEVRVAGLLDSRIERSYLNSEGHYALSGEILGDWTGITLGDIAAADATLEISSKGFILNGSADVDVWLTPEITIGAGAKVEAYFADAPGDFYVSVSGNVTLADEELFDAVIRIDANGVSVQGMIHNGGATLKMSGSITEDGFELSGLAEVEIDVVTGKKIISWVVDGAICGYQMISDGAKCGFEVVTSGVKCGHEKITDGTECGFELVTDGTECGFKTVTSAAKCGVETVGSAALCGTKSVCSKICIIPWICDNVCDAIPNTCSVPKSCTDYSLPKTCTDFDLPKTCDDLAKPKTCADLAHPKSCQDMTNPLGCEHHDVIPDHVYGMFVGDIEVILDNTGLSGEVSGDYCTDPHSCIDLTDGRLKIGPPLEACIEAPGNLGEFCVQDLNLLRISPRDHD